MKNGPDVSESEPFSVGCFGGGTAFQTRAQVLDLGAVVARERNERDRLLDVLQFRSERQEFYFTGDLARMFGIEGNASQILPNPKTH